MIFFFSRVTWPKLPDSQNEDPLSDDIQHSTLKETVKLKKPPSVFAVIVTIALASVHENRGKFTFIPDTDVAKDIKIANIKSNTSS